VSILAKSAFAPVKCSAKAEFHRATTWNFTFGEPFHCG